MLIDYKVCTVCSVYKVIAWLPRLGSCLVLKVLESIEEDPSIPTERKTKSKLSRLTKIRDSIFNLNVIFVALDNEDDAYLIFETLNTRGKDLALTDLVKNHFTKHLKAKGDVDHARIKWENIQEVIHNSSEGLSSDNFIYHFWASRYEAIPQKKLFPKFKKAVTKARAKEYLNFLVNDSKLYRSLYETSYDWSKNEADVSRSLAASLSFCGAAIARVSVFTELIAFKSALFSTDD